MGPSAAGISNSPISARVTQRKASCSLATGSAPGASRAKNGVSRTVTVA